MSMFDKIKGMMGVPDDDDYDDDDMDFVNENTGYAAQDDYVPEEQDVTPKRNKVVNINSTMQLQVVLVKPERFDDASAIADHLNAKRTVVLNLESTNKEVSRRLVDFLSGVAYANNGQIKRVANSTFIITRIMWISWGICWTSLKATACSSDFERLHTARGRR